MTEHKALLEPCPCPNCGKVVDMASGFGTREHPSPDDFAICVGCGYLGVYDKELKIRKLTKEEEEIAANDPKLFYARLALGLAKGGVYGGSSTTKH